VLLFARSTRDLKLTQDGLRFYEDCVQIIGRFAEATQRFRLAKSVPSGELKVGMAPGLQRWMLLRAIPSFQLQYPKIRILLLSVDDPAEIGDKRIDVLLRGRSWRQRGGQRPEQQGLVVRRLCDQRYAIYASPEYLKRAGIPHAPLELQQHSCVAHVSLDRDIQDEWQFAKLEVRQKVKFTPNLLVQGEDTLREAGTAGCGVIRIGSASVETETRSRRLVQILSDWECVGGPPLLAVFRKTRPVPPLIRLFVRHMVEVFRGYNPELLSSSL
jgi:LysR family transcriptional regulator, regulator for bpeEF and oprC